MIKLDNNTVLLLGHNQWQERALVLSLRLGGYAPRVVKDTDEAINIVKMVPDTVYGMVLPGVGCQVTLKERLLAFESHQVSTHICLVGISNRELESGFVGMKSFGPFKLSCCSNDQLLECLER